MAAAYYAKQHPLFGYEVNVEIKNNSLSNSLFKDSLPFYCVPWDRADWKTYCPGVRFLGLRVWWPRLVSDSGPHYFVAKDKASIFSSVR